MKPYWIKTEQAFFLGAGITAHSEDDAMALFRAAWPLYEIAGIEPIEDMKALDQNHVAHNMENWLVRGIWFPRGHTQISN